MVSDFKSEQEYLKAISSGQSDAYFFLALSKYVGENTYETESEIFNLLLSGASNGDLKCAFAVGMCYMVGYGTSVNYVSAREYFNSVQGPLYQVEDDHYALLFVGLYFLYHLTDQVAYFPPLGLSYLKESASKGNFIAAYIVGATYLFGRDVDQDVLLAFSFLKDASERYAPAMYLLGHAYFHGCGTKQDTKLAFDAFLNSAKRGNLQAMYALGDFYLDGLGVGANQGEALMWYQKAGEGGHRGALRKILKLLPKDDDTYKKWEGLSEQSSDNATLFNLSVRYMYGSHITQNDTKAFTILNNLASYFYSDAYYSLALCYDHGFGTNRDIHAALYYYEKAAENNELMAIIRLAEMYQDGYRTLKKDHYKALTYYKMALDRGYDKAKQKIKELDILTFTPPDDDEIDNLANDLLFDNLFGANANELIEDESTAIERLVKDAAKGDSEAMYALANAYYSGNGVSQNYDEAVKLYKKLSKKGDYFGYLGLGICYYYGHGVEQNDKKAFKAFYTVHMHNDPLIHYYIAKCFIEGRGVKRSVTDGVRYFSLASEMGHVLSSRELLLLYYFGSDVKQDYENALKYAKILANANDSEGYYYVGLSYLHGYGTPKNEVAAFKAFYRSAKAHNTSAKLEVAKCFHYGIGTQRNEKEAAKWYQKAADAGNEEALLALFTIPRYKR